MKKRSYLITGVAGFIGSHLAETLLQDGHRVFGLDNLSTGSLENIRGLLKNPQFQFGRVDVRDPVVLDRMAAESEIIFHLAAAVGVDLIVRHPVQTIETNVSGSEVVLKAALRYRNKVLIASTSEVYGKGFRVPFSEDDDVLLGPTSKSRWAYAVSKMLDESLALAYFMEFGLDVVAFRLFNTVGPRQTGQYGMVVPRFVQQALKNENITVYGDGNQSRCFCHVKDVVRALIGLSEKPEAVGRVFNIGSNEEISMLGLAEKVRALTKSKSQIIRVPYNEAYGPGFEDMQRRVPSLTRIHDLIGWAPQAGLEHILESVIDFERTRMEVPRIV